MTIKTSTREMKSSPALTRDDVTKIESVTEMDSVVWTIPDYLIDKISADDKKARNAKIDKFYSDALKSKLLGICKSESATETNKGNPGKYFEYYSGDKFIYVVTYTYFTKSKDLKLSSISKLRRRDN